MFMFFCWQNDTAGFPEYYYCVNEINNCNYFTIKEIYMKKWLQLIDVNSCNGPYSFFCIHFYTFIKHHENEIFYIHG